MRHRKKRSNRERTSFAFRRRIHRGLLGARCYDGTYKRMGDGMIWKAEHWADDHNLYWVQCNRCGRSTVSLKSLSDAEQLIEDRGWKWPTPGSKHYCASCVAQFPGGGSPKTHRCSTSHKSDRSD